jgi:hypothetical protein
MNICIVGHGPSPKGKSLGQKIDSFDVVVRLKACGPLLETEDYGKRVDALCMSTEVTGLIQQVIAGMYWLYPKKGSYERISIFETIAERGAPFMIPQSLSNYWNNRFRELGGKHPNVSTGLAAIFIAAHYYEPKQIVLVGFDSLVDPKVPFSRNDDVPRTGTGEITHDWETENKLLKELSETYKFEIGVLN